MPEKNTLPPLPEPFFKSWANGGLLRHDSYTADQIAARDRQIVELCAALCADLRGTVSQFPTSAECKSWNLALGAAEATIRSLVKGGE